MLADIKRRWAKVWPSALVFVLLASIPFGLFMAWDTDDLSWLWLCAPIIIFLS